MENKQTDSRTAGNGNKMTYEEEENAVNVRKRVVVVVDESPEAMVAFLWVLSHVLNDLDTLILLYIVDSQKSKLRSENGHAKNLGFDLVSSFKELCKAHRSQVQTKVVVVEGDKGPTIVDEVKKLKASVLVLGQKKRSLVQRMFHAKKDGLVDYCIANTKCLAMGVRKKSKKLGGYIINSSLHKNFWLLA